MVAATMEEVPQPEWPSKRIKLDQEDRTTMTPNGALVADEPRSFPTVTASVPQDVDDIDKTIMESQAVKEIEVGILGYVSSETEGFTGLLKKRYTDFLVNEILPKGEVCHLRNLRAPRAARKQVDADQNGHNQPSFHEPHVKDKPEEEPKEANGEEITTGENGSTTANQQIKASIEDVETEQKVENQSAPTTDQTNYTEPAKELPREGEVSEEDRALLVSYLNQKAVEDLLKLYSKLIANPNMRPKDHGTVRTDFTSDRSVRGQIHQAIRRIFSSRIDSSTDNEGFLVLSGTLPSYRRPQNQPGRGGYGGRDRPPKLTWADRGGDYLHFSLFKENKDTMEVVSFLAKQLKTNAKSFQFAGTKDRRAVTVQRVSAYRFEAERVAGINRMLRGSQVGDFEYHKHGLELGELKGNEFVITLRECTFSNFDTSLPVSDRLTEAHSLISTTLASLHTHGFTNYYGLQRFGTFSTRTDTIGLAILQGNYSLACDLILSYTPQALSAAQDPTGGTDHASNTTPIGQDDKSRALAIHIFQSKSSTRINDILDTLPRKFSAEAALIRHLHKHATDHLGAINTIPRNLRMMYTHAYQSLIFNHAATKRWELFGSHVVEGDLVLISEHKDKLLSTAAEEIDADGEVIIQPGQEDRSNTAEEMFERARPLSLAEANGGEYDIFDVVLPQPGFDVLYPSNAIGEFYRSFMASAQGGGLDPHDMRRRQKDFSLSGSYRKVMARIGAEYEVQVKAYREDSEQFVETDLEKMRKMGGTGNGYQGLQKVMRDDGRNEEEGDKIAVVLKFQLGSSQYATMALRELTKGGVVAHKPDFGGRG